MGEITRVLVVFGISVAIVGALFVWPGILNPSTCQTWAYTATSSNGREYCVAAVNVVYPPRSWDSRPCVDPTELGNETFNDTTRLWGYGFFVQIYVNCPPLPALDFGSLVRVTEPNGTSTGLFYIDNLWISPGVSVPPRILPANLTYPAFNDTVVLSMDYGRTPILEGLVGAGL